MKFLILLFMNFASAETSQEVFIRGKIGNEFNQDKVKVIDSYGQVYLLPRRVFPQNFKFEQGKSFAIEVHEKELERIKIQQK